jgi:drug/metabolite transporter (DMT)-like permease
MDPHISNNTRGMILILLSTLCFSSGNGLMSALGTKVPPLQSAFYRYSFQCLISLFSIWVSTHPKRLWIMSTWCGSQQQMSKMFLRSCLGIMAVVSWFSALQILPLADATAINYFNIPFTSILAYIVLREPYRSNDT